MARRFSAFAPAELLALAREAGFVEVRHVSAPELAEGYFAGKLDGLRPSSGEELIVFVHPVGDAAAVLG